ncbi:minor capsid protein [Actinokineospora globicatena]|uniref:minor capsid protein n=1 Tax=Actinokineospora globicatena TaxID=103729 RepID=UPI0025551843|nr:minor capsid protein [Actinokineospora globicatena]
MLSQACCLHLQTLGFGITAPGVPGLPAYAEELPDQPDAAIGVFTLPGPAQADLSGYVTPTVQIVVRSHAGDRQTPVEVAQAIRAALDGTDTVTWAPGTAHAVDLLTVDSLTSHPTNRGVDPRDRPLWSVELRTEYLED